MGRTPKRQVTVNFAKREKKSDDGNPFRVRGQQENRKGPRCGGKIRHGEEQVNDGGESMAARQRGSSVASGSMKAPGGIRGVGSIGVGEQEGAEQAWLGWWTLFWVGPRAVLGLYLWLCLLSQPCSGRLVSTGRAGDEYARTGGGKVYLSAQARHSTNWGAGD